MKFDVSIVWAWIFWMYSALFLWKKWLKVALLEFDWKPFERATYINQARLHSGYHYPRSKITAEQSIKYFEKFYTDFRFAINDGFQKIYAIADTWSKVNASEYKEFCKHFNIRCEEINSDQYFKKWSVEKSFDTLEYSFDALKIRDFFMKEIEQHANISVFYNTRISEVESNDENFNIQIETNCNELQQIETDKVLNTSYASTNQIISKFWFHDLFDVKYELCEVIFCEVNDIIKNIWITVMDWPFFSVMPFGLSWFHSLTSVQHTPHQTSYNKLPKFDCQNNSKTCSEYSLDNCNLCNLKPQTAWQEMTNLAYKFLIDDIKIKYKSSIFTPKIILSSAEKDDSRPTLIKKIWKQNKPIFISVLSGKLNTFYELEDTLLSLI